MASRPSDRRLAASAAVLWLAALVATPPALAGHVAGHVSGGAAGGRLGVNPFSDRSERPRDRLRLAASYDLSRRPERCPVAAGGGGRAERSTLTLEGELSPASWLGLSAALPMAYARPSCGGDDGFGLGDLGLAAKLAPWSGALAGGAGEAQLGLSLTLPTGDADLGLSTEEVGGRAFVGGTWERGGVGAFADAGLGWDFDADSGLVVDAALGGAWFVAAEIALLAELRGVWAVRAPPRASFHGSLADDLVEDGDAALYLGPGVSWRPDPSWVVGLTGRAAVAGDPPDAAQVTLDLNFLF